MFDLAGKGILITGGTSGIGLATAKICAQSGAQVAIVGRNQSQGEKALAQFGPERERLFYIPGDVTKVTDCEAIVKQAAQRFGRLDIVINSAGIYMEKLIAEVTEEDYDAVMSVNIKGTYFVSKFAVPYLRRTGQGAIVNVSSDAGLTGNLLCTAYCASKGAVNTFTKALALELAPYHIRVNAVCPGDVDTPLLQEQLDHAPDANAARHEMANIYPLGRIGTPEEIAQVICFLCSDQASFVTGALWSVDGGITAC